MYMYVKVSRQYGTNVEEARSIVKIGNKRKEKNKERNSETGSDRNSANSVEGSWSYSQIFDSSHSWHWYIEWNVFSTLSYLSLTGWDEPRKGEKCKESGPIIARQPCIYIAFRLTIENASGNFGIKMLEIDLYRLQTGVDKTIFGISAIC